MGFLAELQKNAAPRLVHPSAIQHSKNFQTSIVDDIKRDPEAWEDGSPDKMQDFFSNYIDSGSQLTAGPSIYNPFKGEYVQGAKLMKTIRKLESKLNIVSPTQSKATAQHYDSFASGPLEAYVQLINEGKNDFKPKRTVADQAGIRRQLMADIHKLNLSNGEDVTRKDHTAQMDVLRKFMSSDRKGLDGFDYQDAEQRAYNTLIRRRNSPNMYNRMIIKPLQAIDRVTAPITDRMP